MVLEEKEKITNLDNSELFEKKDGEDFKKIEIEEGDTLVEICKKILEERNKVFQKVEKILPPIDYQELEEVCNNFSSLLKKDAITLLPNMLQCEEDIEKFNIQNIMIIKFSNGNQILNGNGKEVMQKILQDISKFLEELDIEGVDIKVYKYIYNYFVLTFEFNEEYGVDILSLISEIKEYLNKLYIEYNGKIFYTKFNAGATFFGEPKEIISHSLLALEHSKTKDIQSNIIIYSPGLGEQVKSEQENKHYWLSVFKEEIERELVEGKESERIKVFFQGIVNNSTGKIEKYESLLRFFDTKTKRIISPGVFLKYIENTELMDKLNILIINRIVDIIKNNRDFVDKNNIDFTINLDIKYFKEDYKYIFEYLQSKLKKEDIPNSKFILEILEGSNMETSYKEEKIIIGEMKSLKSKGFKIAIDDFGSGYSNFERLIKVKPDFLKIDGSLVKDIDKIEDNKNIVKTITDLAHGLGIQVVAEFISNQEIQEKVKELGVDFSQGFYFSEPQNQIVK